MKALLLREVGELDLVDTPDLEPQAGEEIVEVVAVGICGSDYHSARDGGLMRNPPIIMGHEFSGHVANRRVTANPVIACGNCEPCERGADNLCSRREIIGITRQGAFAESVAVPSGSIVELPDGVSTEAGALAEPLAVALHGVHLAELDSSTRLGIVGSGTIGLLATYLAWRTTENIHAVDLDQNRLDLAKQMGAAQATSSLEGDYDVIIDAAGTESSHRASVGHLRTGGTAVWIGNESSEAAIDAQELVRFGLRILGSAAYSHTEFVEAAGIVDDRLLDLVVQRPLTEGVEAMHELMGHGPSPVKVLLNP